MTQTTQQSTLHRKTVLRRRLAWLVLLLFVLTSLVLVFTPAWLIQPFRPQTQTSLLLSYALRRWSPAVTLLLAALTALLCLWLARNAKWWRKVALVLAFVLVCGTAWLARQNHFEWMFRPLPDPAYAHASESNFVADADMVLAVKLNGEAVAYPVR
jgi:cyanate permease